MSHLDDETVTLAALGEPLDGDASAHLAACAHCRSEIDAFARVVSVGRASGGVDTLEEPPASVWAAIVAETGVRDALDGPLEDRYDAPGSDFSVPPPPALHVVGSPPRATSRPAPPQADRGRRWGAGLLVAASIAGLVVGVGATAAWNALQDDPGSGPDGAVLAATVLDPLPDKIGTGSAEVVDLPTGRELEMQLDAAIPDDAYLQVWLISADVTRMVPVGVIDGPTGHWALPAGVSIEDYPIVDVSVEPYDGDPLHSADSVVRGTLGTADALGALAGGR